MRESAVKASPTFPDLRHSRDVTGVIGDTPWVTGVREHYYVERLRAHSLVLDHCKELLSVQVIRSNMYS